MTRYVIGPDVAKHDAGPSRTTIRRPCCAGEEKVEGTDHERTFTMTVDRGLLALLEAQPGKGEELADFLRQGRELALAESGTVTWYAFKLSETTYGIFDTFEGGGRSPGAPERTDPGCTWPGRSRLLASDPDIRTADILAVK